MLNEILGEQLIIIRIPAIWGKDSPRLNLIRESIKQDKMIDVYSNLICSNLLDAVLARQLRYIIENKLKGIFHLASVDLMAYGQFFEQIVKTVASDKNILRYNLFQDNENTHYFALKSNREDIPDSLQCKNKDIISYLLGELNL
jgi:dTDP-4-dehydrorhamnose reductase